jgi:hypothetical protein
VRTQSADTSIAAERQHIRLLREAGPGRRLALALELSDVTRSLAWRALVKSAPELPHDELVLRFVEIHYGADLRAMVERCMAAKAQRCPTKQIHKG